MTSIAYVSCWPGSPNDPGEPHCQLLSTTTPGAFCVHDPFDPPPPPAGFPARAVGLRTRTSAAKAERAIRNGGVLVTLGDLLFHERRGDCSHAGLRLTERDRRDGGEKRPSQG